jgi:L-aspartate oxidase
MSAAISLKMRGFRVRILTKQERGSTYWAKGGMASAVSEDDSAELHIKDTTEVGGGLCDERVVRHLVSLAPKAVEELKGWGFRFDRDLRLEAGHSRRRVLHVGDETGRALWDFLFRKVKELKIPLALDRLVKIKVIDGKVKGVYTERGGFLEVEKVILATGGFAHLFSNTSNPPSSTGEGIAIACRAGAVISDMEFVQFHPTATKIGPQTLLLSETLRGEGARIVDQNGRRFVLDFDDRGELAPRDILSRIIYSHLLAGNRVFLDWSEIEDFHRKFPSLSLSLRDNGSKRVEIFPVAHFTIGGIRVNERGESSVEGLYALGEVSDTGLHGANRLASNSLMEGLVMGVTIGDHIDQWVGLNLDGQEFRTVVLTRGIKPGLERLRRDNWLHAGIVREGSMLRKYLNQLGDYDTCSLDEESNASLVSRMMVEAALLREESRGVHFRADFPNPDDGWKKRIYFRCVTEDRL